MIRFPSIVFDCDSTLSALEGIAQLASGHHTEVAALTDAAMRGEIPLDEVYGRRLDIVRPTRDAVNALAQRYIDALVADAADTVAALLHAGVEVRVISGGLEPAVIGLAGHLGLDAAAVAAVPIRFTDAGDYAGYDSEAPAARAGGKAEVLRQWIAGGFLRPVMLVGDGATDLEAREEVDLFVAYAGVVDRPDVTAAAPVVIQSRSLAPVLPLALGGSRPAEGVHRATFERGKTYVDEGMVLLR